MTLIYDVETWSYGNYNVKEDKFRTISMYDVEKKEYSFHTYKQKEQIQDTFKKHKTIIGFNNQHYDDPILRIYGIDLRYHNIIDLREVIKKRGVYIGLDNTILSLASIAKNLKLTQHKNEKFDYNILKKDDWTDEELRIIREYNEQDIKVTYYLFKKLVEFFLPLKDFLSEKDKNNMSWLKSSVAVYTYKVMCHQTGIIEEYDDTTQQTPYKGGYVAEPTRGEAHGNIYCLDFASLYPHMYIMGNLASPQKHGWSGGGFFKDLNGTYDDTTHGKIEKTLQDLYEQRIKYKKQKNPLQYALKIVMNTFYGCTAKPVFKNLYNYNTAYDCTKMGQRCIKYSRDVFEAYGYEFLYTDTDSVYIIDPYDDINKLLGVKDKIINKIKKHVPFPTHTFDMDIDYKIKHIWFFKTGDHYKKKHYMCVTQDDKLIIKGLPMIKRDGSGIGLHVFNKYMRDNVTRGNIKHDYHNIKILVEKELNNDINIAAQKFVVKDYDKYKIEGQLQAQIGKAYGVGKHELIPNKKWGVGKSVKYCTIEEFERNGGNIKDVVLNKMWNELNPFLIKKRESLLAWTNMRGG